MTSHSIFGAGWIISVSHGRLGRLGINRDGTSQHQSQGSKEKSVGAESSLLDVVQRGPRWQPGFQQVIPNKASSRPVQPFSTR